MHDHFSALDLVGFVVQTLLIGSALVAANYINSLFAGGMDKVLKQYAQATKINELFLNIDNKKYYNILFENHEGDPEAPRALPPETASDPGLEAICGIITDALEQIWIIERLYPFGWVGPLWSRLRREIHGTQPDFTYQEWESYIRKFYERSPRLGLYLDANRASYSLTFRRFVDTIRSGRAGARPSR